MAKVINIYGGTTWLQHSGYFLRGATSGVVFNSNTKTGGNDNAIIPYHTHTVNGGNHGHTYVHYNMGMALNGSGNGFHCTMQEAGTTASSTQGEGGHTHSCSYAGTNGNTTNANIPNYKSVYIWERTA